MAIPIPKSIANAQKLGEMAKAVINDPLHPSAEYLAEIVDLARTLVFSEETRYYGYEMLGLVEALRGNKSETKKHFQKAFEKNIGDTSLNAMYAQVLRYVGEVKESLTTLNYYFEQRRGDLFSLTVALRLCVLYGQSTKAEQLMQQINALNPQFQSKDLLIDLDMAQRLKKTGIPEAALLDYIQHAYQFAFEHNINLRQPHLIPDVEDEHAFIYILRDNNLTSEQRIQYDLKLAAHMLAYIKAHNNDYPYENVMFFIGRYKDKV